MGATADVRSGTAVAVSFRAMTSTPNQSGAGGQPIQAAMMGQAVPPTSPAGAPPAQPAPVTGPVTIPAAAIPTVLANPQALAAAATAIINRGWSSPILSGPQSPTWMRPFSLEVVEEAVPDRKRGDTTMHPGVYATCEVLRDCLNYLANCGVYYRACLAMGLSMGQFAKLRKEYPKLQTLCEEAMEVYRQRVAEAIHERAVDGVLEPVFYQGVHVDDKRVYSDRLLEIQAKRHIPEYRDHTTTDVNLSGGVLVVQAPAMDREQWLAERRKLEALEGEVVKKS